MYNGSGMDIQHVARLANLVLDAKEQKLFAPQLTSILAFVSKLQKVPTKNVEPTAQVTGLSNVFREDEVDESRMLTQDQALANAKKTRKGYFVVPSVWT